jgi:hypothetical protein
MHRGLWLASLALMLGLAGVLAPPLARTGRACSCINPMPPLSKLVDQAAAVFSGRAILVERVFEQDPQQRFGDGWYEGVHMRIEVIQVWKGVSTPEVDVWTGTGGGDCGTPLELGQPYLLFGWSGRDGRLGVGSCSPSGPLTSSQSTLAMLGQGRFMPPGPRPWDTAVPGSETQAAASARPPRPDVPPIQPWTALLVAGTLVSFGLGAFWVMWGRRRRPSA